MPCHRALSGAHAKANQTPDPLSHLQLSQCILARCVAAQGRDARACAVAYQCVHSIPTGLIASAGPALQFKPTLGQGRCAAPGEQAAGAQVKQSGDTALLPKGSSNGTLEMVQHSSRLYATVHGQESTAWGGQAAPLRLALCSGIDRRNLLTKSLPPAHWWWRFSAGRLPEGTKTEGSRGGQGRVQAWLRALLLRPPSAVVRRAARGHAYMLPCAHPSPALTSRQGCSISCSASLHGCGHDAGVPS